MAEKAVGDDGVVYLGKSSFKMKVGAGMETPPAGTPVTVKPTATAALAAPPSAIRRVPPPVAQTPAPLVTRLAQMGATPTPPPIMRAPRPRRASAPQPPLSVDDDAGRIGPRTKFALVGLVLTAFSCGMMFMVAVDRFWPRPRAQCEAAPAEIVSAPTSTRAVEAMREPELASPSVAAVHAAPPPVEPMPAARPLPAAKPMAPPAPRVVRSPAPAPRVPAAAPAVVARGRATVTARKRPAGAPGAAETMAPTEGWNDPFAR